MWFVNGISKIVRLQLQTYIFNVFLQVLILLLLIQSRSPSGSAFLHLCFISGSFHESTTAKQDQVALSKVCILEAVVLHQAACIVFS